MADFTQLRYTYSEVISDLGIASNTRVSYTFSEAITDAAYGTQNTRLRYHFIEVITSISGTVGTTYKPIVMSCS